MNDTKHTPAPWAMSRSATPEHTTQYIVYAEASGRTVAIVMGENAHANASLVVASHDLLSALEYMAKHWPPMPAGEDGSDAYIKARAAIAKAKGRAG